MKEGLVPGLRDPSFRPFGIQESRVLVLVDFVFPFTVPSVLLLSIEAVFGDRPCTCPPPSNASLHHLTYSGGVSSSIRVAHIYSPRRSSSLLISPFTICSFSRDFLPLLASAIPTHYHPIPLSYLLLLSFACYLDIIIIPPLFPLSFPHIYTSLSFGTAFLPSRLHTYLYFVTMWYCFPLPRIHRRRPLDPSSSCLAIVFVVAVVSHTTSDVGYIGTRRLPAASRLSSFCHPDTFLLEISLPSPRSLSPGTALPLTYLVVSSPLRHRSTRRTLQSLLCIASLSSSAHAYSPVVTKLRTLSVYTRFSFRVGVIRTVSASATSLSPPPPRHALSRVSSLLDQYLRLPFPRSRLFDDIIQAWFLRYLSPDTTPLAEEMKPDDGVVSMREAGLAGVELAPRSMPYVLSAIGFGGALTTARFRVEARSLDGGGVGAESVGHAAAGFFYAGASPERGGGECAGGVLAGGRCSSCGDVAGGTEVKPRYDAAGESGLRRASRCCSGSIRARAVADVQVESGWCWGGGVPPDETNCTVGVRHDGVGADGDLDVVHVDAVVEAQS
ncbi:hypothetical protein R3P38DRAFT_3206328 [Favolaschia claudopus]|uniref:Uncharacterized protein n=1 Tax=Favolaschia claudopus TaxID=2862362 RepID=A0AAW0ALE3_9AGAR